ncbi:DNA primase [Salmonella enterica subsp. arizonae]|uniref:DNA primase n=1 Tax=Salmonella enterica subsp. arizonae TaxID=59203 RepID=A0A379SP98_SALER|nr:DNA primase [Salmonella enterica subsp. arizonae]
MAQMMLRPLKTLSMWDDIADKAIAEKTFTDSLNHMFDSLLQLRQEELIARDRTHGFKQRRTPGALDV